jgi:hypothetical protein
MPLKIPLKVKNFPLTINDTVLLDKTYAFLQSSDDGKRAQFKDPVLGTLFSYERHANSGQMTPLYGAPDVNRESLAKCQDSEMNSRRVFQYLPHLNYFNKIEDTKIPSTQDPLSGLVAQAMNDDRMKIVRLTNDDWATLKKAELGYQDYLGLSLVNYLNQETDPSAMFLESNQIIRRAVDKWVAVLSTAGLVIDATPIKTSLMATSVDFRQGCQAKARMVVSGVVDTPKVQVPFKAFKQQLYAQEMIEQAIEKPITPPEAHDRFDRLVQLGYDRRETGEFQLRDTHVYNAVLLTKDDVPSLLGIPCVSKGEGRFAIVEDADALFFVDTLTRPISPVLDEPTVGVVQKNNR